jgi:DNA-directed RNA polymerase subunit alpha
MPIEDLDLPQRAFNSLKRHGITKVGQLLQTPDDELLRMRNFGKKSLDEIKERLAARGLIEAPIRDESSTGSDEPIAEDDTDGDSETNELNDSSEPVVRGDDGEERIG